MEKHEVTPEILQICRTIIDTRIKMLEERIETCKLQLQEIDAVEKKYDSKSFVYDGVNSEHIREILQETIEELSEWKSKTPEGFVSQLSEWQAHASDVTGVNLEKRALTMSEKEVESLEGDQKKKIETIREDKNESLFCDALSSLGIKEKNANTKSNRERILAKIEELKIAYLKELDEKVEKMHATGNLSLEEYGKIKSQDEEKLYKYAVVGKREIEIIHAAGALSVCHVYKKDKEGEAGKEVEPCILLENALVDRIAELPQDQYSQLLSQVKSNPELSEKIRKANKRSLGVFSRFVKDGEKVLEEEVSKSLGEE